MDRYGKLSECLGNNIMKGIGQKLYYLTIGGHSRSFHINSIDTNLDHFKSLRTIQAEVMEKLYDIKYFIVISHIRT